MEKGLSNDNRIICVCSASYNEKANAGQGGVGYEKMIMTGELLQNTDTKWIIPILRNNSESKTPKFLTGKIYANFNEDENFEKEYENLLRELLNIPAQKKPELGKSPFLEIKETGRIILKPKAEKYHSPAHNGTVTFDFSNNDGVYSIGEGDLLFETRWSSANVSSVHAYKNPPSVECVALVTDTNEINEIGDAYEYDYTSRSRKPNLNEIIIWQNKNGYFAATKVVSIKHKGRNADHYELTFEYLIQTNATGSFKT
jgi:hypothetical protein